MRREHTKHGECLVIALMKYENPRKALNTFVICLSKIVVTLVTKVAGTKPLDLTAERTALDLQHTNLASLHRCGAAGPLLSARQLPL